MSFAGTVRVKRALLVHTPSSKIASKARHILRDPEGKLLLAEVSFTLRLRVLSSAERCASAEPSLTLVYNPLTRSPLRYHHATPLIKVHDVVGPQIRMSFPLFKA